MHGGKSVASALKLRTDYAMNPDKTENGKLISAFACDPHTADAEFLLAKRQYRQFTGREQTSDVIWQRSVMCVDSRTKGRWLHTQALTLRHTSQEASIRKAVMCPNAGLHILEECCL